MAWNLTTMASDLDDMIADLPVTVTILGASYTGTQGDIAAGRTLVDEGYLTGLDMLVVVKASDFTTRPIAGNFAALDGVTYQIERVETAADDISLNLYLVEKTR